MKIAITSDIHLGDPNCVLIGKDSSLGSKFDEFKKTLKEKGKINYLILLGDIFDFSIRSYEQVYTIAEKFFCEIQECTEQIIYVPGNHDFEFWHILEHEVNIINKIKHDKMPTKFRWSVPGVVDDRQEKEEDKFTLPKVTPKSEDSIEKYGDVFLSDITTIQNSENDRLLFNVAYPNVYIITKSGECVLLTHGQYFEPYWSLTGEWALKIAKKDITLANKKEGQLNIEEIVAFNFPLSQLASSGVGQAGTLTQIVRKIQREVKDKDLRRVRKYLEKLDDEILDKEFKYRSFDPREWATDAMLGIIKSVIIDRLGNYEPARFNKYGLTETPEGEQRVANFYRASLREIDGLGKLESGRAVHIPNPPHRVIFGHTHQPIPWDDKNSKHTVDNITFSLHNTGGWLTRKGRNKKDEFCGASIFFYETTRGFYSKTIM